MKVARYEFSTFGLLEDCDMERQDAEGFSRIENTFNTCLPIPDISWPKDASCWFTEEGDLYFREELNELVELVTKYLEDAGLGELRVIRKDIAGGILYADRLQVVTSGFAQ